MTCRRTYTVELTAANGETLAEATRYSWNAAIRASEALVREHARRAGRMYAGDPPVVVMGQETRTYRRDWSGFFASSPETVQAFVIGPIA